MPEQLKIIRLLSLNTCYVCNGNALLSNHKLCEVCNGLGKLPVAFDKVDSSTPIEHHKQPSEPHFSYKFISHCYGDTLEEITKKYAIYHEKFIKPKFIKQEIYKPKNVVKPRRKKNMMQRKFRVKKMEYSDVAHLINIDNYEDFYAYTGHKNELIKNKIYLENELTFSGTFVSLKGSKRL